MCRSAGSIALVIARRESIVPGTSRLMPKIAIAVVPRAPRRSVSSDEAGLIIRSPPDALGGAQRWPARRRAPIDRPLSASR